MPAELAVGDKAPDFSLPDETGLPVSLKKFKGRQVVLYFYPKDDTPGCTKEACGFRDSMTPILKAGSAVVGVSLDGGESHRRVIAKHQLPFSLLSDEGGRVGKGDGGYKEKKKYGRKVLGIGRRTFVIDGTG